MPTLKTRQVDWSAGEWSPTLGGRVDVDKYGRGAELLENFVIGQGGGIRRRPGTRYQGTAHRDPEMVDAAARARLIPFIFTQTEAFVVEMTELRFRFYTSAGRVESAPGVPVEVPHGYFAVDLPTINWTPSADVLLFAHQRHAPARLERLTTDGQLWRFRPVIFDPPPSLEFGERALLPGATLTPGALTGSATFTASAAMFLASDVQRQVLILAGVNVGARATITAVLSPTQVTGAITEPWTTSDPAPATHWKITDSPVTTLTPSVKDPVGAVATLTLGSDGFRATDVGKFVHAHGGVFRIEEVTDPTHALARVLSEARAITEAPAGSWTLEEAAFSVLNGYPAVVAFAEDRLWFFATPAQPLTCWASKSGDYFNFAAGSLDDDALIGTFNSDQVNTIGWALPYNRGLMVGTQGEEWVIDAGEGNTLTPASLAQAVKPATSYGSTARVRPVKIGTVILFVTRSRRKLRELVPDPNAIATSVFVAPDMMLLADHLTAPAWLNGVKLDRRMVEMAWQRDPQQTVWGVREDGTLLSFAYIREQNVTGWCRHILQPAAALDGDGRQMPARDEGRVESVCVIPHGDGDRDQVWLSVARTVGGTLVRHIETLEEHGVIFDDGFVLDSTIAYDGQVQHLTLGRAASTGLGVAFTASGPVFTPSMVAQEIRHVGSGARARITVVDSPVLVHADIVVSFAGAPHPLAAGHWGIAQIYMGNLLHLEGRTVSIVGDGAVYPDQVVVGGAVPLVGGPGAMKIEAGFGYRSRLRTLRPEVAGLGTVQGRQKRHARVVLRVYKSVGFTLNGKVQPFRHGQDPLGTGMPPPPFSGDLDLTNLGWDDTGQIEVDQPQPLPLTLLGLFPLLSVDD